jgi:hypothetical protein
MFKGKGIDESDDNVSSKKDVLPFKKMLLSKRTEDRMFDHMYE